jgi:pimeloyl-ACP methyl ester carboxylesterase
MPASEVVQALRQTIAEHGTFTFVGFAYPPRAHQARPWSRARPASGERCQIGIANRRPALIEFLAADEAPPVIVPTGRFSGWFDIGERRLFLRCTGHRSPTVVFEGGLTTDWFALQNRLSGFTRVCSYDHPNGPRSRSDVAPTPRTAHALVVDLHALLRVAHVPGPYVLAGRSNGGLFTQLYASTHPRQVAGLVLIDAVDPAYHRRTLAMLKPLVPPDVWEAVRQDAMTPDHRLLDPERVDIRTSVRHSVTRSGNRTVARSIRPFSALCTGPIV